MFKKIILNYCNNDAHNMRFHASLLHHNFRFLLRILREYICINSYANSPCQLVTTFPMVHTRIHESHKSNKRIERFNMSRNANVFFKLSTREERFVVGLFLLQCSLYCLLQCLLHRLMFLFHHLIFLWYISALFSAWMLYCIPAHIKIILDISVV